MVQLLLNINALKIHNGHAEWATQIASLVFQFHNSINHLVDILETRCKTTPKNCLLWILQDRCFDLTSIPVTVRRHSGKATDKSSGFRRHHRYAIGGALAPPLSSLISFCNQEVKRRGDLYTWGPHLLLSYSAPPPYRRGGGAGKEGGGTLWPPLSPSPFDHRLKDFPLFT